MGLLDVQLSVLNVTVKLNVATPVQQTVPPVPVPVIANPVNWWPCNYATASE